MLLFPYLTIAFIMLTLMILFNRQNHRLSDKIASVFLGVIGISMFFKLIIIGALKIPMPERLLVINTFPFLYGPSLLMYIKSETFQRINYKNIFIHILPFIILTSAVVICPDGMHVQKIDISVNSQRLDAGNKKDIPEPPPFIIDKNNEAGHRIKPQVLYPVDYIFYALMTVSVLYYFKKSIGSILKWKSIRLSRLFKEVKEKNCFWLLFLSFLFSFLYILTLLIMYISNIHINPLYSRIIPDISHAVFTSLFCYFLILRPDLVLNPNHSKKYAKSGLKDEQLINKYLERLEHLMIMEKPYLNCDLSIEDLAETLEISRHYLTQIINEYLHKKFSDYINEFRINCAKEMLSDSDYRDHSIIRIAYDSGFNTKAGFNMTFKKFTGLTPSEYRNKFI